MTVFVRDPLSGAPVAVDVDRDATVRVLSKAFAETIGSEGAGYEMVQEGETLGAGTLLSDIGVCPETCLEAIEIEEDLRGIQELADVLKPDALNRVLKPLRDYEPNNADPLKLGVCLRFLDGYKTGYVLRLPAVGRRVSSYIFPVTVNPLFGSEIGIEDMGEVLGTAVIEQEDLKDTEVRVQFV